MPPADTPLACQARRADFDHPGDADGDLALDLARLCRHCPALQACGAWSLATVVEGFAAGMTAQQRRKLRKARAA